MKSKTKIQPLYVEALLDELDAKGKTGIKLPCTEQWAKKYLGFLKTLTDKKLVSQKTYDEKVNDVNSRTLDKKLLKKFYNVLGREIRAMDKDKI